VPTIRSRVSAIQAAWRAGADNEKSPARATAFDMHRASARRIVRDHGPRNVVDLIATFRDEVRWQRWATVVSLLSVVLVGVGLYQNTRVSTANIEATNRQLELMRTQQNSQRFTEAISLLGQEDERNNDKLDLRLGAIYSLRQLMIDSPDDEPAIVEVLSAFIRMHAPRGQTDPTRPAVLPTMKTSALDVSTALMVLGSRPDPNIPRNRLTHLTDATLLLPQSRLDRANLVGSDLAGSNLWEAELSYGDLTETHFDMSFMDYASLAQATLHRTYFWNVSAVGASFFGSDLREAMFIGSNLQATNFDGANLRGAHMGGAKGLTSYQLHCVLVDENTRFPANIAAKSLKPVGASVECNQLRRDLQNQTSFYMTKFR
jgi:hypothetical protein